MNSYQLAKQHRMLVADEIDLIKKCMAMTKDNPICINIGANVGTSVCAMLEEKPDAFIFSIDKQPCPQEKVNLIKCGLPAHHVVRILSDSTKINSEKWPLPIDVAFIDGSHTIEDLTKDCHNWMPHAKIILIHDYNHPNYTNNGINKYDETVDNIMSSWEMIGKARYLIAFKKVG